MHLVRDGYPRAVAPVSSGTISSHFDSCVDLSRKDAFCCSSSRNVSTEWCLTGLFQFPVPAVEGGSNLMEKSPYAALGKYSMQLNSRLNPYRDICSPVIFVPSYCAHICTFVWFSCPGAKQPLDLLLATQCLAGWWDAVNPDAQPGCHSSNSSATVLQ